MRDWGTAMLWQKTCTIVLYQLWPSCCEAVHHQWWPETTQSRRKTLNETVTWCVRECFTCGCGTRWGGWWQSRGSSKPGGGCQKAGRVSECGAPTLQPDEVQRDDRMSRSVGVYAWLLLQGGLQEPIQAVMGRRHGYNLDKSLINCSVGCANHCNTVSPKTLEMRHRWPCRYHLELLLNIHANYFTLSWSF